MLYSTEITRKLTDVYGVYRKIGPYDENLRFYEDISFINRRWDILMNYIKNFEDSLSAIGKISDLYKRKFNHDFKRKKLLENIDLSLLTQKYPLTGRKHDARRLLMLEEMLYGSLSKFIKSKLDLLIGK